MLIGAIRDMVAPGPQRVLLDLREGGGMRGFHLTASLSHLMARGVEAEFWAIHADKDDVLLELELLRRRSGQLILRWTPNVPAVRFSYYVAMADALPHGSTWDAARRCCRHAILGLMFPDPGTRPKKNMTILDGHDLRAFAMSLETRLQPRTGLRRLLGA
nr:hypothetical protein [uncultured Roseococcus sp.]